MKHLLIILTLSLSSYGFAQIPVTDAAVVKFAVIWVVSVLPLIVAFVGTDHSYHLAYCMGDVNLY